MFRFCPELMYMQPFPQRNAVPMKFRRDEPVEFPVLEERHRQVKYGSAPVFDAYWDYDNGIWNNPHSLKELQSLQREYNKRRSCAEEDLMMREFMASSATNWEEIGRFPVLKDFDNVKLKKSCEKYFEALLRLPPEIEKLKRIAKPGELPPDWGKVL